MNNELGKLNKRIQNILEEKELPEAIKEKIEKIYEDFRIFYEKYFKNDIEIATQDKDTFNNLQEYFEKNYLKAIERIQDEYREECREKADIMIIILSTLESQKNKSEDKQIEQSERDILNKCLKNDRKNNMFTNSIINIIIDAIEDSKNQLFKDLDLLETNMDKVKYINDEIKVIKDNARLKENAIKKHLDIDDEEISKQIFLEYEQYKKNKEKSNQEETENAHKKFVNEYRVSEENLQVVAKAKEDNSIVQEKEYEGLPRDVIE